MQANNNIAFLCHAYHRGGVTTWMVDMAVACAARGKTVYFVTVDPKKAFHSAGGRETMVKLLSAHSNIRLLTEKVDWSFEFGTSLYRSQVYSRLLLSGVPAGTPVILADDLAVWHTSKLCSRHFKFIGVLHSDEAFYYDQAKNYKPFIDVFVCVSDRVSKKLAEKCPDIPAEKIFTIPCGIPVPEFKPVKNNTSHLNLVYVGRIGDYQKRVSDIVKICSGLVSRQIPFRLKMIGDGGQRAAIEQKFADAGLTDVVSFLGWLSKKEIFTHLFTSDLLLLTSDFEGMPIVVMEALASGCGVISTRVSGVEDYELSELANNCLWVNTVGDIDDAIGNIEKAMKIDFDTRCTCARKMCEEIFDINTCFDKYMNAIAHTENQDKEIKKFKVNYINIIYSFALSCSRYIKLKLS